MKDILTAPPHERLKLLREGEKVLCAKCGQGTMTAVGDFKTTNTFFCSKCKKQIIIN